MVRVCINGFSTYCNAELFPLPGIRDTISLRKCCLLRITDFVTRNVLIYFTTKLVTAATAFPALEPIPSPVPPRSTKVVVA